MAYDKQVLTALAIFVFQGVTMTNAGECCKTSDGEKWCTEYCCESLTLHCCNNKTLQASSEHRSADCMDWFKVTIWGPIIVAIIATLVMLFWCFCFYKCQCRQTKETPLIIPDRQPRVNILAKHHVMYPNVNHVTSNPNKFIIPRPLYTNKSKPEYADNEIFEC